MDQLDNGFRYALALKVVHRLQLVQLMVSLQALLPSSKRIPLDAPETISITPLRASAFKCSSAALGERKPSWEAISAPCWWHTRLRNVITNQIVNLLLPCS